LGLIGWLFKFCEKWSFSIHLKAAFAMFGAIGLIIAAEESTMKNGKYIACLSFGYTCFRVWGEKKPTE